MRDKKLNDHLSAIRNLKKDFCLLAQYVEDYALQEYVDEDVLILINNDYYQLYYADYEDDYFDSYEEYVTFTSELIEDNVRELEKNVKRLEN